MSFDNVYPALRRIRSRLSVDAAHKSHASRTTLRVFAAALLLIATVTPELAMAAPWDQVGTQILGIFTGGLTRTIAIVAVIGCGLAALAGKLSWNWAINIVLGIVLIFGATALVDYLITAAQG